MKSPGQRQNLDPQEGPDLGPMLRDLRSMPVVSPTPDFEQNVLARLEAEAQTGRISGKRFFLSEFLFKGSRLAVLSGSLAVVFLAVIGIRLLQAPETREAAPDLQTPPQFVPAAPEPSPETPAATQSTSGQNQDQGAVYGISPQLRRKVQPGPYRVLQLSKETPGRPEAGTGEADTPTPSPAESEEDAQSRRMNVPEKADQTPPAADKSGSQLESRDASEERARQRTAVGGAVEFKNEYTPVQGKDTGILKSTDSTRAAKRALDSQRIGK